MYSGTCTELKKKIAEKIQMLSGAYTPEWKFDLRQMDMGAAIAHYFADRMAENVYQYRQELLEWDTEAAKLFGETEILPEPACTYVVMDTDREEGAPLKAGTVFTGQDAQGEEPVVFRADQGIWVSPAKISYILAVSGKEKKVQMLYGGNGEKREIPVFPAALDEDYLNEVCLVHPWAFDGENGTVKLLIESGDGENPAKRYMSEDMYRIFYQREDGQYEAPEVFARNDCLLLQRSPAIKALVIRRTCADGKGDAEEVWKSLRLHCNAGPLLPDFSYDGKKEFIQKEYAPFGEELSLYQEWYLGQEEIFRQEGARIEIKFRAGIKVKEQGVPHLEEHELKPIMRVPYPESPGRVSEVYIQEVQVEYYNGLGYKPVPEVHGAEELFGMEGEKRACLEFTCPPDWETQQVGGYSGRLIRIRITKADGCYMFPARYHYPVIKDLEISGKIKSAFAETGTVLKRQGKAQWDLTDRLRNHQEVEVFSPFPYREDAMLFGFDEKLRPGPVSLYLGIRQERNAETVPVSFEYAGTRGFKPLKAENDTHGFQRSGVLTFMMPEDMKLCRMEGAEAYWIRMLPKTAARPRAVITDFHMNGVKVSNREMGKVQEYFLDESYPSMSCQIPGTQIIKAHVWVNEKGMLSKQQMEKLYRENSVKVKVEKNLYGEVERFFVKWEERSDFQNSSPEDRHFLLDRKKSRICFGDGIHVKIPENIKDMTFFVQVESCAGERGNVGENMVTGLAAPVQGIYNITNPAPASGGRGMARREDPAKALAVMENRGRLITEKDYEREVLAVCPEAEAALCRIRDGAAHVWVLMKDYEKGAGSFLKAAPVLRRHLSGRGMLALGGAVRILEPLFVTVTVELWVKIQDADIFFDERENVLEEIREYFRPVKKDGTVLPVGYVPEEEQIKMKLYSLQFGGELVHYEVTFSYTGESGKVSRGLSGFLPRPDMALVNGKHEIYVV